MPTLLLKGKPIGTVKGVLFDKDGTLSHSENYLVGLAKLRIQEARKWFTNKNQNSKELKNFEYFLQVIYGINEKGLSPEKIIAVGPLK